MIRLSKAKLIVILGASFLVSIYLVPFISVRGITPDFLFLFFVFYSFRVDWKKAPLMALIIGLFKDVTSTRVFGIEIFSLVCAGFLASYLMGKIEREDILIHLSFAFLCSLFYELLCLAGLAFMNRSFFLFSHYAMRAFWSAFYTVLFLPFAFAVFERMAYDRTSRYAGRQYR